MDFVVDIHLLDDNNSLEGAGGGYSVDGASLSLLAQSPGLAIPYITILGVIAIIGTFGNFMIVGTLAFGGRRSGCCGSEGNSLACLTLCCGGQGARRGHQGRAGSGGGYAVGNLFITNLACSDCIVTAIINPFAIIGVTHGYIIYDGREWLCNTLASLCVMSCVVSLLTVGCISVNRYVFVCHQRHYRKIYTRYNSYFIVFLIWVISALMDLPSHLGWSRHEYDMKTHKCLWSRTHAHSYTVFYVCVGMLVPLAIITLCYALIFRHIRAAKLKIERMQSSRRAGQSSILKTIKQVRTMFIIFASFGICWAPYVIVLLSDYTDSFPLYVHLYASLVAHLHASVNFAIYGLTNNVIRAGYRQFIRHDLCCGSNRFSILTGGRGSSSTSGTTTGPTSTGGGISTTGSLLQGGTRPSLAGYVDTDEERCSPGLRSPSRRKVSDDEASAGLKFIAVAFRRRLSERKIQALGGNGGKNSGEKAQQKGGAWRVKGGVKYVEVELEDDEEKLINVEMETKSHLSPVGVRNGLVRGGESTDEEYFGIWCGGGGRSNNVEMIPRGSGVRKEDMEGLIEERSLEGEEMEGESCGVKENGGKVELADKGGDAETVEKDGKKDSINYEKNKVEMINLMQEGESGCENGQSNEAVIKEKKEITENTGKNIHQEEVMNRENDVRENISEMQNDDEAEAAKNNKTNESQINFNGENNCLGESMQMVVSNLMNYVAENNLQPEKELGENNENKIEFLSTNVNVDLEIAGSAVAIVAAAAAAAMVEISANAAVENYFKSAGAGNLSTSNGEEAQSALVNIEQRENDMKVYKE